ncbi:hypothetical protein EJB05_55213, partial [Eragrostis curvula]
NEPRPHDPRVVEKYKIHSMDDDPHTPATDKRSSRSTAPAQVTNTIDTGHKRQKSGTTSTSGLTNNGRHKGDSGCGIIDDLDPAERSRRKARERYAQMSEEKKEERRQKAKEYRQRKKAEVAAAQDEQLPLKNNNLPPNIPEETFADDYVGLPDDIVIDYTDEKSVDRLIGSVFPNLQDNATSATYMSERVILSTKNEHVDELNDRMIDRFPGEVKVYYSFDSVDDSKNYIFLDYINSITPTGLPPHELKLKKNCPVILIHDIDPHHGLCKGARLVVRELGNNVIKAEVINGQHAGEIVLLPRIPLSPLEDMWIPCKFKRKQFPIKPCFAMTINNAQGQKISNVGIYLPEPVFSHGRLYVALSRGVSRQTTWILPKPNKERYTKGKNTKRIMHRDVLET